MLYDEKHTFFSTCIPLYNTSGLSKGTSPPFENQRVPIEDLPACLGRQVRPVGGA